MRFLPSEKLCQEIMLKSLIFGVKNGFNTLILKMTLDKHKIMFNFAVYR